jgi:hypothetical protein
MQMKHFTPSIKSFNTPFVYSINMYKHIGQATTMTTRDTYWSTILDRKRRKIGEIEPFEKFVEKVATLDEVCECILFESFLKIQF